MTIPWRLYCEQHQKLAELTITAQANADCIKSLESRPPIVTTDPLEKERLEIERLKLEAEKDNRAAEWNRFLAVRDALQKYAEDAPTSTRGRPDMGDAWIRGAWQMLERTMADPVSSATFRFFVEKANNTGLVPGNVLEAKAVLMGIASSLTVEQLKP